MLMFFRFLGSSTFQYEKGTVRLLAYICSWTGGVIRSTVHHDYAWVGISELDRYDFAQRPAVGGEANEGK